METPYFLIHEEILKKNINDFIDALEKLWPNSRLAYSVKTNSLPWVVKYMNSKNVMAEVVSDEEYQLALLCGYEPKEIVFNGPIKGESFLRSALKGKSLVNIDSKHELKTIADIDLSDINTIGVRVNLAPSLFDPDDIGYSEDGFRFGFSEQDDALLNAITQIGHNQIGLHLHCNSITRSLNVYRSIAKYAAYLIKKYNLTPSYIDMGGGYFGGVEGKPTPEQYIGTIKEELQDVICFDNTQLILEPGSALIGSAADLYTSVVDVKETTRSTIVTTDGSRFHIDPLWIKNRYMYSTNFSENREKCKKQVICGYTCMDHDRLMVLEDSPQLLIGDQIIYHRVGAYSMTLGAPFIRYFPDVYVDMENQITKVRSGMSVDDYYRIESL